MRVLIVEDDLLVGDGLQAGLSKQGFTASWVQNAEMAEAALFTDQFDAIILDLGLPKISGFDLLKKLRTLKVITPILILTARDALEDRVQGLDFGADDYLVKPFALKEVVARVRALIRRAQGRAETKVTCGNLTIDPTNQKATYDNIDVEIKGKEFKILEYLVAHKNQIVSKAQLESLLCGWGDEIDSNSLEVHIHNIRKKLSKDIIKTIRGSGYMIVENEK